MSNLPTEYKESEEVLSIVASESIKSPPTSMLVGTGMLVLDSVRLELACT